MLSGCGKPNRIVTVKYHIKEKEYGSYMNNKFVPSDSNWKLLKIQSFL